MNALEVILVAIACLGAAGSGVSIGILVQAARSKRNPEGLPRLVQSFETEMQRQRDLHQVHERELREAANAALAAASEHAMSWQMHARELSRLIATPPPAPPPDLPPPPPKLNPDQSVARVTGEGLDDATKLRDALMEKLKLTAEQAEAVLAGKMDGLAPTELIEAMELGIIRDETKVT